MIQFQNNAGSSVDDRSRLEAHLKLSTQLSTQPNTPDPSEELEKTKEVRHLATTTTLDADKSVLG